MTDAVVNQEVTLPCTASPDTNVVWNYQRYCENFEHGMHFCSNPTEIATGNQYQIRVNEPGEHSLLINAVTTNMTGLYICKDGSTGDVICRVLLNVFSKYVIHTSNMLLISNVLGLRCCKHVFVDVYSRLRVNRHHSWVFLGRSVIDLQRHTCLSQSLGKHHLSIDHLIYIFSSLN